MQGLTWSQQRMVTAAWQQTGCLVTLSDNTWILVFSHKDCPHDVPWICNYHHPGNHTRGQRFIVSYTQGQTWSNSIFVLHVGGMYASSVVLRHGDDKDTIVTASAAPFPPLPNSARSHTTAPAASQIRRGWQDGRAALARPAP